MNPLFPAPGKPRMLALLCNFIAANWHHPSVAAPINFGDAK